MSKKRGDRTFLYKWLTAWLLSLSSVWIALLVDYAYEKDVAFDSAVKSGSLYIFATVFSGGYFGSLFFEIWKPNRRAGLGNGPGVAAVTLIVGGGIFLLSSLLYVFVVLESVGGGSPVRAQGLRLGMWAAIGAILYSLGCEYLRVKRVENPAEGWVATQ